jgi:hypothetical protein
MLPSDGTNTRAATIGRSILGALARAAAGFLLVTLSLAVGLGYGWDRHRGPTAGPGAVEKRGEQGQVQVDEGRPGRPVVAVALRGRCVNDETLDWLGELKDLRRLELEDTRVTDAGIRRLAHLMELRDPRLDGVAITDEGLPALRSLKNLEVLILLDTRIEGSGLEMMVQQQQRLVQHPP